MKQLGLIVVLTFLAYAGLAQESLKELTNLLDLGQYKLENHLQRKGFRRAIPLEEQASMAFRKEDRKTSPNCIRGFEIINQPRDIELVYQTTSLEEYTDLKQQMKQSGFNYPSKQDESSPILYQRQDIRIQSTTMKDDSVVYYVFKATKKELPKKKEIMWAEDLLQLDAQEYLIDIFGRENVKTDTFYFTETEINRCSVLYPNTSREVIFIWNDETNLKDISFILIGGNLHPREVTDFKSIAHNTWTSRQGLSCGMTVQEIEALNKEPVRFYNWHAESAGYLAPNNKGAIDFSRIGLVFNCLNCSFVTVGSNTVTNSTDAVNENQKVYLTSLIVLPEKKARDTYAGNR
ncbi:MAG: hypothetical protein ACJ75B_20780 [Flavisolibacter sp.]